jgi:hypothetical protein
VTAFENIPESTQSSVGRSKRLCTLKPKFIYIHIFRFYSRKIINRNNNNIRQDRKAMKYEKNGLSRRGTNGLVSLALNNKLLIIS